jgi:hypothetical protein
VGKPEGSGPLGRPRHIKMDLQEVKCRGGGGGGHRYWIDMAQDRDR